jgi:GT2 family glycosyltransferase
LSEPSPVTGRICLAVVTRDRAPLLERCLLPALGPIAAEGFDVLVVDQSADDATKRLVATVPGVRYTTSGPGLSCGRNVAVAETTAPLIAFTDDDVTVPSRWLESMAAALDAAPDIGVVCGRAIDSRGVLLQGTAAGLYRWPTVPFGLGSGFNIAFRREALAAAGAFDEDLGAGARFRAGEDTDMLYRLLRAGWAVSCVDHVTVVHDSWRTTREEFRVHYAYGLGAGAQTAKHVMAGDPMAASIGRQALTCMIPSFTWMLVTLRLRSVALQSCFASGMVRGYLLRRRDGPAAPRRA